MIEHLSCHSKTVRWAYLLTEKDTPSSVSLCVLFWRIVLITPAKVLGIAGLCGAILFGVGTVLFRAVTTKAGWLSIAAALLIVLIYRLFRRERRKAKKGGTVAALIGDYIEAKKQRFCPIIRID